MRRTLVVIALLTCLAGSPALAEPPGAALRLYAAGEFIAAADLADTQPSAASHAFASRALVAACASASPATIDALLTRAEASARQALTLDQRSADAHLQLALVYGMEGRRSSIAGAFASGYAARGKHLIDAALALDPNDAHAHAMLGAWHLEVIRRGGPAGALLYGARTNLGIAEFERARALAPDDLLIQTHYAVALLALDPVNYQAQARTLIDAVLSARASDMVETLAQQTAQHLRTALSQGPQSAQRVARASFL